MHYASNAHSPIPCSLYRSSVDDSFRKQIGVLGPVKKQDVLFPRKNAGAGSPGCPRTDEPTVRNRTDQSSEKLCGWSACLKNKATRPAPLVSDQACSSSFEYANKADSSIRCSLYWQGD